MNEHSLDKDAVTEKLNRILELELAGVVRYTHYALMVYGYNRIPIIAWMREQAVQSLGHAQEAGELITHFGGGARYISSYYDWFRDRDLQSGYTLVDLAAHSLTTT